MRPGATHNADGAGPAPGVALYRDHLGALESDLASALGETGFDALVISAGRPPVPARDDQPYPFREEPFFARWCPFAATPGAVVVLAPGSKPVLLHPLVDDFWHVPPVPPAGKWTELFDIRYVASDAETERALRGIRGRVAAIFQDTAILPGNLVGSPQALLNRLSYGRARKTGFEIECIAAANRIAAAGHEAVIRAFENDISEFDLHMRYLTATRQSENELPYPNIIAINEHSAVLHYQQLDRQQPPQARTLLVDAGARYLGFASDITRTTPGSDKTLAGLIAAMEQMQQTLCAQASAGTDFVSLNDQAHRLLGNLLSEHAIVSCSGAEAYDRGLTRTFLPHGLGHLLGLQVHDAGGWLASSTGDVREPPAEYPSLRLTRRLEPGFVVTIEPGIYFIDQLLGKLAPADRRCVDWTAVERLRPYGGIRIEDDVAIKAGDNTNLTREAFAALAVA